ncbi:hypothetical protein D0867_11067 [Hortaea werneckii]|uniref:DUF125-domain-containing protein n=1 Tax=Hortaea werneckii TaxID=91943 RepID=A0A3M6YHE2_HORWE|nr:hypothetical protein KC334_g8495 [Hortaea werneckii]KAI7005079.1 hypothetical protein KC355_g8383 [Hortaea werneckii]RMY02389.1 hypothetical protein D0867_11067 [Hortaea werneckii]RMY27531.1 hypothetical protein D0866_10080 [Hortaea werneckii]
MVFAVLKALLSNNNKGEKYSPLRPSSPQNDIESNSSPDARSSKSKADIPDEESQEANEHTWPARINPRIISDATIGLSDGLTVPFALTAGLSALGDSKIVFYSGFAELVAGGISMGLGGYLGAKSEAEAYRAALAETREIVAQDPQKVVSLVRSTFTSFGFSELVLSEILTSLLASPERLVDFLMKFHHQLVEADHAPSRACVCGVTIAFGYVVGGFLALLPYLLLPRIQDAFLGSAIVMTVALFGFGWFKTAVVGEKSVVVCLMNGIQTMMLGGIAAGAAVGCVKAFGA